MYIDFMILIQGDRKASIAGLYKKEDMFQKEGERGEKKGEGRKGKRKRSENERKRSKRKKKSTRSFHAARRN